MACLPTVESRFDLRVDQQAEIVFASSKSERGHTMSNAFPNTHRALSMNQQIRRGHLPLMNLCTWQAKAEGGL
jgi:hypothetical protein